MSESKVRQFIIIFILAAIIYALVAQGAFYRENFLIVKLVIVTTFVFWLVALTWSKTTIKDIYFDRKIVSWLLILSVTVIFSLNFSKSFNELLNYYTYAVIYLLLVNTVKKKDDANLICATLILIGTLIALLGLLGIFFKLESLAMQTEPSQRQNVSRKPV